MPIIEPVIRPPAEAGSFLLQLTCGCSSNHCTFCGAYLNKPFRIKSEDEILNDIRQGAKRYPQTRKVFLIDGDALVLGNKILIPVLDQINSSFPKLKRISSYANGYNIINRSTTELKELFRYKLNLIYIGLESGDQKILEQCNKKSTVEQMIMAVRNAADAGIKSSIIVLLGLGGKKFAQAHVKETIVALNKMQPRFLSFLSLMLIPGTGLYDQAEQGGFEQLNSGELLEQTSAILSGLELEKTIFRTNHASNYLPLEGRLPQDKQYLLTILKQALAGKINLRPEIFRGL
ncbi:MAG: radical SAM protein [Candidatus Omnitrophica bacterium]|nr:radical SAM protein [Candidatus Omnitrophota bacterium]